MKKGFTVRAVLLVLVLLLAVAICGCNGTDSGVTTDNTQVSTDEGVGTDTPSDTGGKKDMSGYVPLSSEGSPTYTIVYQSSNIVAGATASDYAKIANNIAQRLESKLTGADFKVVSDKKIPADGKVITVGNVGDISASYYSGMKFSDYRVRQNGDNIAMVGYVYGPLYIASEQFCDATEVVYGDIYVKKSALDKSYSAQYQIGDITLGGKSVSDYVITYSGNDKEKSEKIRDKIRDTAGFMLSIEEDSTASKAIAVVGGAPEGSYKIAVSGEKLVMSYASAYEWDRLWAGVDRIFTNVTSSNTLALEDLEVEYSLASAKGMMSFNVKNVWNVGTTPGTRDDVTAAMVLQYAPDFVCLQEFDTLYRNASNGLIGKISGIYAEVDVAGLSKAHNWNPIFYNKDKYTVLESGYVYFPDHTSSVEYNYAGGTADGKSKFRSLVWAVLKDMTDGSLYLIGNLHFSTGDDVTAIQQGEAALAISKIKEIAAKHEGCITLVAGDYNSNRSTANKGTCKMIDSGFKDTFDMTSTRTDSGSTHNGNNPPAAGYLKNAIDHILTLNDLTVYSYSILTDSDILASSDHCPTIIKFSAKQ